VPESVVVRANRVVLRQVLLAVYTSVLQHRRPGCTIGSRVERVSDREAVFELDLSGEACWDLRHPDPKDMVPPELVHILQGRFECLPGAGGSVMYRLTLPGMPMHAVLLIDDNRSIHHLFRRYLSGLPYQLLSAYDAPTGLAVAQSDRPEAIIVDIMMPDQDGWELLAALKDSGSTRQTPVLICSVLDQEALAISLSASGYLKKPVTQNALLTALEELGLPQPR
jgi:CheY-like chemotaxis protein